MLIYFFGNYKYKFSGFYVVYTCVHLATCRMACLQRILSFEMYTIGTPTFPLHVCCLHGEMVVTYWYGVQMWMAENFPDE